MKNRKYLTRVLAVMILAAVILSANYFAELSFDKPRNADYYNRDIRQLEKNHVPVDLIIVGASQVYRGCNVDVISREMGIGEVIDCAAPIGFVDGLYYMLRDLLRRFEPKAVVIDMTWRKFLEVEDPGSRFGMYLCSDRLEWPDRIDFALHCFNLSDWANLFPLYRNGKAVWGMSQLKRNYRDKKAVAEGRPSPDGRYQKNGFIRAYWSCPQGSLPAQQKEYSNDMVSEYSRKYVLKTWELCREKNIPVIWITIPGSMEEVLCVDDYQESMDYIGKFVKELGGEHLNFSYLKNREEILPDPYFSDKLHLNGKGSEVFSEILADALKKTLKGEDTGSLFYKNLEEMKKDVHRIVACNGRVRPNGDGTLTVEVKSLQGTDEIPQFRLMLIEGSKTAEIGDDEADGQDDQAAENAFRDAGADSLSEETASSSNEAGQESRDIRELRPWQDETTFLINENEIPEGYVLRLEARRKGGTQTDAYVNRLTGEYQGNRVIW